MFKSAFLQSWVRQNATPHQKVFETKTFLFCYLEKAKAVWRHKRSDVKSNNKLWHLNFETNHPFFSPLVLQFMDTNCASFLKSFHCGFIILCFRKRNLTFNSVFWSKSVSRRCSFNEAVFSRLFYVFNAAQLNKVYLLFFTVIWKWSNKSSSSESVLSTNC